VAAPTPLLVIAAEAISVKAGVSQTFIGTTLVGFTTSFPEIAVSVAAILCIGLGVLAILARAQQRPSLVRVESLLIVAVYGLAVALLALG